MNNEEQNKFLGMLYDILVTNNIKTYKDKPKDLKEKVNRLNDYLDKLKRVQDRAIDNERYLDMIKNLYYDRYIIKEENIPDGYLKFLENQYLEQGHGHINLVEPKTYEEQELRKEHIETIIRDQKDSLDNWLNYFLSKDSYYLPMWAKVWAFQGMLQIGNLNKDKDGYDKRSKTTTNPFVSFDSEILGRCVTLIEETFEKKEMTDEEVKKLVESGSFAKLYGKLLANKKQVKTETTDGIWIKYNQESEYDIEIKTEQGKKPEYIKLYNSLQGYNTGWCTAGARETAKDQILGGDFYVYYSCDKDGEYKIPRLAIRMDGNQIGEIRGIAENQNIESNMELILEEKLKEFPNAEMYKKRVSDMKHLTEIYYKNKDNIELTLDELLFLYEIKDNIISFGYDKDPRIKEIKNSRNQVKDFNRIFKVIDRYDKDLDLSQLTTAEGLVLPKYMNGDLNLSGLVSAKGLILPKKVNSLDLSGLISSEDLVLPEKINSLNLRNITSAKGLKFPKSMSNLNLESVTESEDLVLPERVDNLNLKSLKSAKGLVFPKSMNANLNLGGLIDTEGLILPEKVNYLNLSSLKNIDGLTLPKEIHDLNLSSLISVENLLLPKGINNVNLRKLRNAKELIFPNEANNIDLTCLINFETLKLPTKVTNLNLWNITSSEGLILPKIVKGTLNLNNLIHAEGLILPASVKQLQMASLMSSKNITWPYKVTELTLSSLIDAEDLLLPERMIKLDLNSLMNVNYLYLPKHIDYLNLNNLSSFKGLILPQRVSRIYYKDRWYKLKEIYEIRKQEEISSPKIRKLNNGFVNNTIIIGFTIIISLLSIFIALLIIK